MWPNYSWSLIMDFLGNVVLLGVSKILVTAAQVGHIDL